MTVKKCYRGHEIAGANLQTAGKRQRCRACQQASETTLRKPELRADMDKIADEKYANIMSDKKSTRGTANTATKECYRGHKITGANIQPAGKRERCRACRQANEETLRNPELRENIDTIADEKYADIMSGKKTTPRPARTATTAKKKPASRAKTTHQRSKSTKLNKYLEPVDNMPSVDEVLRRMPNGCKQYMYEVDTPVNKWPSMIVSYLLKYDLARETKRPSKDETLILSKRGHDVKRRLTDKLRGR